MSHFHAHMIEDTGSDTETTALGDSFATRAEAQTAMLRESGSLAGQKLWTLVAAGMSPTGIDEIEFLNRNGRTLALRVWECTCSNK